MYATFYSLCSLIPVTLERCVNYRNCSGSKCLPGSVTAASTFKQGIRLGLQNVGCSMMWCVHMSL